MLTKDEQIYTIEPVASLCAKCKNALEDIVIMGKTVKRFNYTMCSAYSKKPHNVLWDGANCEMFEERS